LLLEKYFIILHCQIETETGSAGEQPVRDKFDRPTEKSKEKGCLAIAL